MKQIHICISIVDTRVQAENLHSEIKQNPGVMLKTPGLSLLRIPFIQTHKPGAVVFEKQIDFSGRPVPVLGDDQFRQMVRRGVRGFVIIVTVQKHDDVRVLFQGTGLPQIGKHGPFHLSGLHAAA